VELKVYFGEKGFDVADILENVKY